MGLKKIVTLIEGTSNWSGDYFKFTGGAGLVVECEEKEIPSTGAKCLRKDLEEVFLRDWNSVYSDEI